MQREKIVGSWKRGSVDMITKTECLNLIRKWRKPSTWNYADGLKVAADTIYQAAEECGGAARVRLDRYDIDNARTLKAESERLLRSAAKIRGQRMELVDEVKQIEEWVRANFPSGLAFTPEYHPDCDAVEAIKDLTQLEIAMTIADPLARKGLT